MTLKTRNSTAAIVKKRVTVPTRTKAKPPKKTKGPIINEETPHTAEPEPSNKFHIKPKTAEKAVRGVITLTLENGTLQNRLFNEFPLFLQINSMKVPHIHPKIVRIPVKHSILPPDAEVCLIAPDVKGIPNKNHEEHLDHYEKLLQRKHVTGIKKIMTFHEFRTEYENFEMKRRLVDLYDCFLVDGKISGKTVKKCGKIFYTKHKVPTAIKLHVPKLKEHIDKALKKTPLYLHGNGDSFMVQIGHNMMESKDIVENLFQVLEELDKHFPGGFSNMRSLNLATFPGITIPLYVTLKNKSSVLILKKAKKRRTIKTVKDELTTRTNLGVIVKPTGQVTTYKLRKTERKEKSKLAMESDSVGKKSPTVKAISKRGTAKKKIIERKKAMKQSTTGKRKALLRKRPTK